MKKLLGFILVVMLVFAFAACDNDSLSREIDDLRQKITELENQNGQQSDKIAELENELKYAKSSGIFQLVISAENPVIDKNKEFFEVNYSLQNTLDQEQLIRIIGNFYPVIPGVDYKTDREKFTDILWLESGVVYRRSIDLNEFYDLSKLTSGVYELTYYADFYVFYNHDALNPALFVDNQILLRSNKLILIVE